MNIVMLGSPGAGKGTYAGILSKKYNMPHISTGDLFRDIVKEDTELGRKVKGIMDSGALVPDDITLEILKKRLEKDDCKKGFILDGYPRNISQAESLSTIAEIDIVLSFVASESVVLDRLGGRLTCKKCGAIFHLKNIPPKVEGKCDHCGADLYQRPDQMPEAIKKRLDLYGEVTAPLIDYYKEKGIIKEISSNPPIAELEKIIDPCTELIDSKMKEE